MLNLGIFGKMDEEVAGWLICVHVHRHFKYILDLPKASCPKVVARSLPNTSTVQALYIDKQCN